jgi:hypothetical protein
VRNAAGRRAPLQVDDLRALAHKVNRKHLKSDVDHARRCGKQVVPFCLARGFHDQFVRSIQGCYQYCRRPGFASHSRRSCGAGYRNGGRSDIMAHARAPFHVHRRLPDDV